MILPGRNEFRHFDTRTLKLNSERVSKSIRIPPTPLCCLGDPPRNLPNYILLYDNDGKFFILNQDGRDPRTVMPIMRTYILVWPPIKPIPKAWPLILLVSLTITSWMTAANCTFDSSGRLVY
jgi:hypothetical protein